MKTLPIIFVMLLFMLCNCQKIQLQLHDSQINKNKNLTTVLKSYTQTQQHASHQNSINNDNYQGQNAKSIIKTQINKENSSKFAQKLPIKVGNSLIEWPQQSELYHIYSFLNPRLVLDVAKANDGYHDLILYEWQHSLNQMFYFKHIQDNLYYIVNAGSGEYLKKSEKITYSFQKLTKLKFDPQKDQKWQLIPAKQNAKNSFYIVSEQNMAMDVKLSYAQSRAEIIQYTFHKQPNQIWYLRPNTPLMSLQQVNDEQKLIQKASKLMYNILNTPQNINDAITLQQMKSEMEQNNYTIPQWIDKPQKEEVQIYDIPDEISLQEFTKNVKNKYQLNNQNKLVQQKRIFPQNNKQEQKHKQEKSLKKIKKTQQRSQKTIKVSYVATQCAKTTKVAYIWMSDKQMPFEYKHILEKCKLNTVLLTQKQFKYYVKRWNHYSQLQIIPQQIPIRQKINLLKLLYLYFESGIYADFDTQINQHCWQKIFTDEIIFTNRIDENIENPAIYPVDEIVVPQQSFMMVRETFNPQVKKMLQEEIIEHDNGGGDRWRQCKYRQCLIVECQRHYRDNTYRKGYN